MTRASIALLALFLTGAAPPCKPQLLLFGLSVGEKDFRVASDEQWLGVFPGDARVAPVRLKATGRIAGHHEGADAIEFESDPPGAEFAVRCVNVVPGPIRPAPLENPSLTPEQPMRFRVGGRDYEVVLQTRDPLFQNAEIVLKQGAARQVIFSTEGFADEPHFDVVFAGDLDRDGRLDLVTSFSRKYSYYPYRLFLSSAARNGQLVREVASYEYEGC